MPPVRETQGDAVMRGSGTQGCDAPADRAPATPARSSLSARRVLLVLVALTIAPGWAAPAAAHADVTVSEDVHHVPASSAVHFPVELHYHRLVGHVRVVPPAEGAVALLLTGPETGATRVVAGPGDDFAVNVLIPCCEGSAYTRYELVLENRAATAVHADVRLTLLHDGVAVLGDDAETGAAATPVLLLGGFSILFASRFRRAVACDRGGTRTRAVQAFSLFAALWVSAAAFAGWGMLRYGGGPVAGTLAATADLPATGNSLINTHALILLAFMALSITAVGTWTEAARRASAHHKATGMLGLLLGAGALTACSLWAVEYGTLLVPAMVALATAAFPLWGGIALLARRRAG